MGYQRFKRLCIVDYMDYTSLAYNWWDAKIPMPLDPTVGATEHRSVNKAIYIM